MHQSSEINELAAALSAAQGEFSAAKKDSENPHFRNKFASLKSIVETAMPTLSKHGLSVTQMIGYDEEGDVLTLMLMHSSGQYITETMRLHMAKLGPQEQGSATTYARRYSFQAALGIVSEEDDDGNAASSYPRGYTDAKPAKRTRPAPVTQMDPKRQLLAACEGDTELAKHLWDEAMNGRENAQLTDTEIQLLLSRAKAEVDAGRPM